MQIVTDCACDLSDVQKAGFVLHVAPMRVTLDGTTYSAGIDIQPEELYRKLAQTSGFPTTSQPAAGEFAELYRELSKTDPDILSIHISSGLSGTMSSARAGAAMVPEARVTFWDTLTLSAPEAWQVEAALRALKAGWSMEQIFDLLRKIQASSNGFFTLDTLKYLIHGGRISHMKGLLSSLLGIRPIIGVEKVHGTYVSHGFERTFKRAILKLTDVVSGVYGPGAKLRVQLLHGYNPEGLAYLREKMGELFDCTFLPSISVSPVLGAHTGGSLVGLSVCAADVFNLVP